MSLHKIEEMVDHLNSQPNASNGFSASKMYKTGMEFGLTCKEVKDIFLGAEKAISRGCYAAIVPSPEVIAASTKIVKIAKAPKAPKAPKVLKVAAKKAPKANKKQLLTEVVPPGTDLIDGDLLDLNAPESDADWTNGICYIASPEEIVEA